MRTVRCSGSLPGGEVLPDQGVSAWPGGCLPGRGCVPGGGGVHPPVDRIPEACENIDLTFPQLLLRTIITIYEHKTV